MDGNQVSSMLFPEKMSLPGFDVVCVHFEAYPEVHLRSSLWTPHDVIASRLFRNVHHLCHWAEAAYGCLKPAPESRLRRTCLHLWYSMARSNRSAFFLTQDLLHFPARVLVTPADAPRRPRGVERREETADDHVPADHRRSQQRYEHRLRHLVHRTGDVSLATNLGVPQSTARGWLGAAPTVVVSLDVADLTEPELRLEVLKLRRRVQKLTALLRLALALLRTSGFRLTGERMPDGRAKIRILRAVNLAREHLPLRAVLRFLRMSPSRFHAWSRRQSACSLDDLSLVNSPFLLQQLMLRPAMDTLRGDDVGACLAPRDSPNLGAFAAAPNPKCWRYGPTAGPNRHDLGGWDLQKRTVFSRWGSPAFGPDANEASGLPSCS